MGDITFGQAIEEMKNGRKVARRQWGDTGVFCVYFPPVKIPVEKLNDRMRQHLGDRSVVANGYFCQFLAHLTGEDFDGVWQPGWHPTPDDMQMFDWYVLDDGPVIHKPKVPKLTLAR